MPAVTTAVAAAKKNKPKNKTPKTIVAKMSWGRTLRERDRKKREGQNLEWDGNDLYISFMALIDLDKKIEA